MRMRFVYTIQPRQEVEAVNFRPIRCWTILQTKLEKFADPNLLVGNETADDAAVYDLGNGTAIIENFTGFLHAVEDDPDFGRIAATNAISDIFAMGGKPIMAIAILGFPINKSAAAKWRPSIDGGRFAAIIKQGFRCRWTLD